MALLGFFPNSYAAVWLEPMVELHQTGNLGRSTDWATAPRLQPHNLLFLLFQASNDDHFWEGLRIQSNQFGQVWKKIAFLPKSGSLRDWLSSASFRLKGLSLNFIKSKNAAKSSKLQIRPNLLSCLDWKWNEPWLWSETGFSLKKQKQGLA